MKTSPEIIDIIDESRNGFSKAGFRDELIVYSCSFGSYDKTVFWNEPDFHGLGMDITVFTDQPYVNHRGINFIRLKMRESSPRMVGKTLKILPHRIFGNERSSLYFDSNIVLRGDIRRQIEPISANRFPIALFKHNRRKNAIQEVLYCYLVGKIDIEQFVSDFFWLFFKPDSWKLLIQGGLLYRNHRSKEVRDSMELWHKFVACRGERDQIYAPIALRKYNVDKLTHYFNGEIHNSSISNVRGHNIPAFKNNEVREYDIFQQFLSSLFTRGTRG